MWRRAANTAQRGGPAVASFAARHSQNGAAPSAAYAVLGGAAAAGGGEAPAASAAALSAGAPVAVADAVASGAVAASGAALNPALFPGLCRPPTSSPPPFTASAAPMSTKASGKGHGASNSPASSSDPVSGPSQMASRVAEFFEDGRADPKDKVTIGRPWEAWELRHKSFEDLHALWYVLLKERTRLYSQKQLCKSQGVPMPQPHRIPLVKKSMCRIKQVLTERALSVEEPTKQAYYRHIINSM